jgi:hypothetical protein
MSETHESFPNYNESDEQVPRVIDSYIEGEEEKFREMLRKHPSELVNKYHGEDLAFDRVKIACAEINKQLKDKFGDDREARVFQYADFQQKFPDDLVSKETHANYENAVVIVRDVNASQQRVLVIEPRDWYYPQWEESEQMQETHKFGGAFEFTTRTLSKRQIDPKTTEINVQSEKVMEISEGRSNLTNLLRAVYTHI